MNKRLSFTVFLLGLVGCSSPPEIRVPIASPNDDSPLLKEDIGIETLGGVFTPLLQSGCSLPCEITHVFSTADDNQEQIVISLFQGTSAAVSGTKKLGVFRVSGIAPAPRGTPQIAVSFKADAKHVVLRAFDKQKQDRLKWTRVD